MADFVDPTQRSLWMSRIRSKDTAPERIVRRRLHAAGLRFRLNVRSLPGTPDIVLRRFGVCIFVNGCFWHQHMGCAYARVPSTNQQAWVVKFARTAERDRRVRRSLTALGWRVIDIWECGLKDVLQPDLDWLESEVRCGHRSRVHWPARPRRPKRA